MQVCIRAKHVVCSAVGLLGLIGAAASFYFYCCARQRPKAFRSLLGQQGSRAAVSFGRQSPDRGKWASGSWGAYGVRVPGLDAFFLRGESGCARKQKRIVVFLSMRRGFEATHIEGGCTEHTFA